jgi:hypothetical protein
MSCYSSCRDTLPSFLRLFGRMRIILAFDRNRTEDRKVNLNGGERPAIDLKQKPRMVKVGECLWWVTGSAL